MREIIEFLWDALGYIINIRLFDLPRVIGYVAISGVIAYCVSMLIIGFPVSVIEAIIKRKLNKEKEGKVTRCVAVVIFVALVLRLIYEKIR